MPSALLRPCPESGCPELVVSGRCARHAGEAEQRRGSASSRGYTSYWTRIFRPYFVRLLIAAGIAPVCGAALPGGPSMVASRCKAEGLLNDKDLHLHHDPPLRPEERSQRRKVCYPLRVGFLCSTCHNAETRREQQAGIV